MTVASEGEVTRPFAFLDSAVKRRESFEKIFDFAASSPAFLRLIFDHLLCPDIRVGLAEAL
jgi:hypothetical protein